MIRTQAVSTRTTLLIARYRFHLQLPSRSGSRELVAEDVATLAFEGSPSKPHWLPPESVAPLLHARPSGNVPAPQAAQFITRALDGLPDIATHLAQHGDELAARLLESHRRVRQASADLVRGLTVSVEPGADVLGVFVYVPPAGGEQ